MKLLILARQRVKAPTTRHELYAARRWNYRNGSRTNPLGYPLASEALPACAICGTAVQTGVELTYRLRGSNHEDRLYRYAHHACLRPLKTGFA